MFQIFSRSSSKCGGVIMLVALRACVHSMFLHARPVKFYGMPRLRSLLASPMELAYLRYARVEFGYLHAWPVEFSFLSFECVRVGCLPARPTDFALVCVVSNKRFSSRLLLSTLFQVVVAQRAESRSDHVLLHMGLPDGVLAHMAARLQAMTWYVISQAVRASHESPGLGGSSRGSLPSSCAVGRPSFGACRRPGSWR